MKFAKFFIVSLFAMLAIVSFVRGAQAKNIVLYPGQASQVESTVTIENYSFYDLTLGVVVENKIKESCSAAPGERCSIRVKFGQHTFWIFETENPESKMIVTSHISGPKIWQIGNRK